jgi:hypothetical protein
MNVLKNLLNSEKAVVTGLLVIAASVLAGLGKMSIDQWISYSQWMAGIYVGGKSIQGAAGAISNAKTNKAIAEAAMGELAILTTKISANDAAADAAADNK